MTSNAILNLTEVPDMSHASEIRQWEAVMSRDPNQDGRFVFAVSSTGVYCRPSCPSRRPRRENVTFFRKPDEAERAGYRACLRCRPRAIAAPIRYNVTDSPLRRMLVAATEKGICAIQFAVSDEELDQGLKHEFPFAIRRRDDSGMREWKEDLLRHMRGQKLNASLPLDIQATAFQRRVWTYLQSIPFGSTKSYSQVAKAIGQPTATRAVARACATNQVAVAIPCHRVVREDGGMGGYRWGIDRKKALLEMERA